ncbi:MAG: DUF4058 family protein [Blastochloris sp.]|nr:DUF4058 family protein [Blastochloris sp.]
MQPPFPGMDPYLEAPSLWPDVHAALAAALRRQLQRQISPRYAAVLVPYTAFETIDVTTVRAMIPDIGIVERDHPPPTATSVAIAPAPMTGLLTVDVPTRYSRIEIRTLGDETLVTAIEVLSPVNKRPGADGADAYERKRREILRSEVHLLEIDLLRAGRRPSLATPLPANPYFVFLSRVAQRPRVDIWPLTIRDAIPVLPVPLRAPDPDVPLDLGGALQEIYADARYDLRIDYRQPPPAPELPPDDAVWLDAHLRERGLRD